MTLSNTMKRLILCGALLVLLCCQGCFHRWSEEQRAQFEAECRLVDTVQGLSLTITGFRYDEVDSIRVYELEGKTAVDSFYAYSDWHSYDSLRSTYYAHIDRTLHLTNEYVFFIPGYKLYRLSDMKMIVWAQWTMMSEGYGCVMGSFVFDGKQFEHDTSPHLKKRGFKYSWEK